MNWPEVKLIIIVALFTRLLPRLINPDAVSTDSYYHLLCAQSIRENRFRIPGRIKGLCFPSPYDYPPLFHWLISFFSKNLREKLEMWISGILDLGNILLFYVVAIYLNQLIWEGLGPPPLICTLLFIFSPALLFTGAGPRAYQATPRVLGELYFNIAMVCAMVFHLEGGWGYGLFAVVSSALIFMSSKFSIQALVFILPVIGIILKSYFLFSLPVLGFGLSLLLTRGHSLTIIRGQIGHLTLFARWTAKHYPNVQRKNRIKDIINLPGYLLRAPSEAYRVAFLDNSYLILIMRHPQLLILTFGIFQGGLQFQHPGLFFLWCWAVAGLVSFFVVSLRPFLFLGEPERYVEHGVIPLYLLAAYWAWDQHVFAPFCVIMSVSSMILYWGYVFLFVKLTKTDEALLVKHKEVFQFLKSHPAPLRLLPIGSIYGLAYHSGQEIFYSSGNFATCHTPIGDFKELYKILGLPNENLVSIIDKYNLDGIVAFKSAVKNASEVYGIDYDFSFFERVFENPSCEIYFNKN